MPKKILVTPGDDETTFADDVLTDRAAQEDDLPALEPSVVDTVPVLVVTEVEGMWRLQWKDATGRLRQSWSQDRLEASTLDHLESLPPYGDDLESVLVDICVPISVQVATLHWMNIWQIEQITYQAIRDILASQGAAEYIALEARVQALDAQKA